jgi:ribosomal protein S8E
MKQKLHWHDPNEHKQSTRVIWSNQKTMAKDLGGETRDEHANARASDGTTLTSSEALCSWQRIPSESPMHHANPGQKSKLRQLHVLHNTQETTHSDLGITCKKRIIRYDHSTEHDTYLELGVRVQTTIVVTRLSDARLRGGGPQEQGFPLRASRGSFGPCWGGDSMTSLLALEKPLKSMMTWPSTCAEAPK